MRKSRIDSVKGAGEMFRAEKPAPPDYIELPVQAMLRWDVIVSARDYTSWTAVDLEHAANLACCLADLEKLRQEVRREGDTIVNPRGNPMMNPKHSLIEVLSRRSVALSRMLHVHAEATVGASRDHKKRNAKQAEVNGVDKTDELLARPRLVK